MGKRNSSAKPAPKKRMDKLDAVFSCPFCGHGSSVECHITRLEKPIAEYAKKASAQLSQLCLKR